MPASVAAAIDAFASVAKAVASLCGAVLVAVTAASPSVPSWVPVVLAASTAVATWAVPNSRSRAPGGVPPTHARS